MSHLGQDQLYAAIFDFAPLAAADEQHLTECADCRRAYAELADLRRELAGLAANGGTCPLRTTLP